jgi:hypothetical protein
LGKGKIGRQKDFYNAKPRRRGIIRGDGGCERDKKNTTNTQEHYSTKCKVMIRDSYIVRYKVRYRIMNVVTRDDSSHVNSNFRFFSVLLVCILSPERVKPATEGAGLLLFYLVYLVWLLPHYLISACRVA